MNLKKKLLESLNYATKKGLLSWYYNNQQSKVFT